MSKPMPEHKPPPFRLVRFIEVPRIHAARYGDLPWADVVTAAQRGEDGLRIVDENIFTHVHATPETAWLREYRETGGCLLFHQNWCDETHDARWRRVL